MLPFDLYFDSKTSSIRKTIREKVLSSSLHDLVQVTLNIGNESGTSFVQGNEMNDILLSVINFQNSLMKVLINCQFSSSYFSDVELITESGAAEANSTFSNTKFTIIEPVRMENGSLLRFYISKSALSAFPSALQNLHLVSDGFGQLVLPQVDLVGNFGVHTEKHTFEVIFTGVELISTVKNFKLEKPISRKYAKYLPNYICDYSENLHPLFIGGLIMIANVIGARNLMDLLSGQIAHIIKGKSPHEIRQIFGIQDDFTPEEREQIRRENE